MTTTMAEVMKLAARPAPYDSDERTSLEFRFKLENYLTPVNEKYVALLQNTESQPVANVPAGTRESSVVIRSLSRSPFRTSAMAVSSFTLRTALSATPFVSER